VADGTGGVNEAMGVALAGALGGSDDFACGAEPPHAASKTATTNAILTM
jgi:hypothetical protein